MSTTVGECAAVTSVWDCWNQLQQSPTRETLLLLVALAAAVSIIIKLWSDWNVGYQITLFLEYCFVAVPLIQVEMTSAELEDDGIKSSQPPAATAESTTKIQDPARPGWIQCYDPSTNQYLGQVPAMTPEQVHELCVKAAKAQQSWSKTSFRQRRQVLRTIQKYILHHVRDICRVSTRDSGKPPVDALLGEVLTTCEKIRCINAWGEVWLRPSYRPTGPVMMHKTAFVEYVPLGVVATIAPWNYPFHNLLNHIISGIFAGNAVVGKISEYTSWSSVYYSRIVRRALQVHGHDPDLVQTVTGFGDAGSALVTDPLVDKIIFTGSPEIGKKVMLNAAQHLKPVILELGGKDVMVICDDVKLESSVVVPHCMRGCFQNCGQNCIGVERVLVYESIYDQFLDIMVPKVKALRQGIPLVTCGSNGNVDCASMVTFFQMDAIQALVDDAVAKGAILHCGGRRSESAGQFYMPTVLSGVTPDMRIFNEEVFGPIMSIIKVPKDDDDECVRLVNTSRFGLGSSVYSGDKARGLRLGRQFRTGMCTVNDFASNYLVQSLPFGGVKESGFGRFGGIEGLQSLCLERSILVDCIPGVQTSIPPPLQYPIDPKKGMGFGEALVQFFYNESWLAKVKGIFGLVTNG